MFNLPFTELKKCFFQNRSKFWHRQVFLLWTLSYKQGKQIYNKNCITLDVSHIIIYLIDRHKKRKEMKTLPPQKKYYKFLTFSVYYCCSVYWGLKFQRLMDMNFLMTFHIKCPSLDFPSLVTRLSFSFGLNLTLKRNTKFRFGSFLYFRMDQHRNTKCLC